MGQAVVYILTNFKGGALYTGVSTRIRQRFAQHQAGVGGSFTKSTASNALSISNCSKASTRIGMMYRETCHMIDAGCRHRCIC
ncbi:GIY-YIG nuclease family protein [Minwuia sp.]|uniref:GIY-YIG nuclease family protein n=1 Tax=Minwuia sp. TaxID=2493630 RepID=UPI003A8DEF92